MPELTGQSAIVTGGSRGIGKAIAKALLAEGMEVAICGRSASVLDAAKAELGKLGRVVTAVCDVADPRQVRDLFALADREFGDLGVLVNNAGVGRFGPIHAISVETWEEVIGTNLNGPFYCTRLAAPRMKRRGSGFILNIGSLAGKHAFASGAAYNASKFGLVGLTEAMMLDLRHDGIRVSTIMPGSVQTEFRPGGENAEWKLDPDAVAAMAVHLIKTPARNLASRVEMRPSQPPKK